LIKTLDAHGQTKPAQFTDSYETADALLDVSNPHEAFGSRMAGYDYPPHRAMLEIMASTHSIGILDGKFVGDPLDIEMLEGTGFDYNTEQENSHFLVEAIIKPSEKFKQKFATQLPLPRPEDPLNSTPSEYSRDKTSNFSDVSEQEELNFAIIRRFEFSSRLQRMSVITRSLIDTKFRIFAKGSPEKIKELSLPESIPANFHDVLTSYTQNGLRVLGMACKILPDMSYEKLQSKTRDFFENDLVFCGFLIMENMLKPETKGVIDELNECGFKSIMITGDNALTGISVARKCGLVNPTSRVFLGDIDEDNENVINWQDIDSQERLNRYTLNQSNSIQIELEDESFKEA
jgi:cation-transporting ATPase 13A2